MSNCEILCFTNSISKMLAVLLSVLVVHSEARFEPKKQLRKYYRSQVYSQPHPIPPLC